MGLHFERQAAEKAGEAKRCRAPMPTAAKSFKPCLRIIRSTMDLSAPKDILIPIS